MQAIDLWLDLTESRKTWCDLWLGKVATCPSLHHILAKTRYISVYIHLPVTSKTFFSTHSTSSFIVFISHHHSVDTLFSQINCNQLAKLRLQTTNAMPKYISHNLSQILTSWVNTGAIGTHITTIITTAHTKRSIYRDTWKTTTI